MKLLVITLFVMGFQLTNYSFGQLILRNDTLLEYREGKPILYGDSTKQNILLQLRKHAYQFQRFVFTNPDGRERSYYPQDLFPMIQILVSQVKPEFFLHLKEYNALKLSNNKSWISEGVDIASEMRRKIKLNKYSALEYKNALNRVSAFGNSLEGVMGRLELLDVLMRSMRNQAAEDSIQKIHQFIKTIKDTLPQAMSHILLADFCVKRQLITTGVELYNETLQLLSNTVLPNRIRDSIYGEICVKLSEVYSTYTMSGVESAMQERIEYLSKAYMYFESSDIRDKYSWVVKKMMNLYSFLLLNTSYFNNKPSQRQRAESMLFKNLERIANANSPPQDWLTNLVVAKILAHYGYKQESIIYAHISVLSAFDKLDEENLFLSLSNLANCYAKAGNATMALLSSSLYTNLAKKTSELYHFYYSLLQRAMNNILLNKYTEALGTLNGFLYRRQGSSLFELMRIEEIVQAGFGIKVNILSKLRMYDSAKSCAIVFDERLQAITKEYVELLKIDSRYLSTSLDQSKNKLVNIKQEENRELAEKNDEITALNHRVSNNNKLLVIIIIIVAFLLLLVIRQFYKSKVKSKEIIHLKEKEIAFKEKEAIAVASDLRLRSGIKNHNLRNHYEKIAKLLREKKVETAYKYSNANKNYFTPFYEALVKEHVTLAEEIDLFKKFVETENIYYENNLLVVEKYSGIDPLATKFLCDVFVPIYENAITKAFVTKVENAQFTINVTLSDNILCCEISDNGCGNKDIQLKIRPDSYLDMLRKRIEIAFSSKNITHPNNNYFSIESHPETGTLIKFYLPYETI